MQQEELGIETTRHDMWDLLGQQYVCRSALEEGAGASAVNEVVHWWMY